MNSYRPKLREIFTSIDIGKHFISYDFLKAISSPKDSNIENKKESVRSFMTFLRKSKVIEDSGKRKYICDKTYLKKNVTYKLYKKVKNLEIYESRRINKVIPEYYNLLSYWNVLPINKCVDVTFISDKTGIEDRKKISDFLYQLCNNNVALKRQNGSTTSYIKIRDLYVDEMERNFVIFRRKSIGVEQPKTAPVTIQPEETKQPQVNLEVSNISHRDLGKAIFEILMMNDVEIKSLKSTIKSIQQGKDTKVEKYAELNKKLSEENTNLSVRVKSLSREKSHLEQVLRDKNNIIKTLKEKHIEEETVDLTQLSVFPRIRQPESYRKETK
jgi:hypothetical protein